jgi:hypothetical protein
VGEKPQEDEGIREANLIPGRRIGPRTRGGKERCGTEEKTPPLADTLGRTVRHFFPDFTKWLSELPDPRDQSKITYDPKHLLWIGFLLFLLHLESRRQLRFERATDFFHHNLIILAETGEETIADPDTLEHYLRKLPQEAFAKLPVQMVQRLIRMKVLDSYRLNGFFLVAIDGSGQLVYNERHCAHCLHRTDSKSGKTVYFHPVLEAKLVTANGFAFSVATEFIENPGEKYDKQDCELKAFYRLEKTLKARFPRTPLCLLLDAIYAGKPVFDICKANHWEFFITFKEGSMPALYQEARALLELSPRNEKVVSHVDKKQKFRWVESLPYEGHDLKAIFCGETRDSAAPPGLFAWLTNFAVTKHNVEKLANNGGRLRWKIENEGFNTQKNGGYALEHSFSGVPNAAKNYYFLLQIAHLLNQLMAKGSLLKNFVKHIGSLRNFARRLSESLRNVLISPEALLKPGQIRINTS